MNDKLIQELQTSVKTSRDQLISLEQSLTASGAASKVALYLAHGHVNRNRLNQFKVNRHAQTADLLHKQATAALNLSNKTVSAASNSLEESKKAISNVATAASNMQMAANAITHLSSDVAGVMAVAQSVNYDSDIYDKVSEANDQTRQAARCAEKVSMVSLSSTVNASQSAAEDVLNDANATFETLTGFEASTAQNYSTESEKALESNSLTTEAVLAQNTALQKYEITKDRDKAVKGTIDRQNQVSNHELKLFDPALEGSGTHLNPGYGLTMSFRRFMDERPVKEYRLMLVPRDEAPAFNLATAKSIKEGEGDQLQYIALKPQDYNNTDSSTQLIAPLNCAGEGISDCTQIVNFIKEANSEKNKIFVSHYEANIHYPEGAKGEGEVNWYYQNKVIKDFSGRTIKHGTSYCVFLYVVYNEKFQSSTNNTMGFLSTASYWYTPKFRLPTVSVLSNDFKILNPHDASGLAVQFKADKPDKKINPVEYRAVFVYEQNLSEDKPRPKDSTCLEHLEENKDIKQAIIGLDGLLKYLKGNKDNDHKVSRDDIENFEKKRNGLIKDNCLLRGLLLSPIFDKAGKQTEQCRYLLKQRQDALQAVELPTAEVVKNGLIKANELYKSKVLLENWKNTEDDKKDFNEFVKNQGSKYLNLLAKSRTGAIKVLTEDIRKELSIVYKYMPEGTEKADSELPTAAVLLYLILGMGSNDSGEVTAEFVQEVLNWQLEILDACSDLNELYDTIIRNLNRQQEEAIVTLYNYLIRPANHGIQHFKNRDLFPFDQEVMSMLTKVDYVVAGTDNSKVKTKNYTNDLNGVIQAICQDVSSNEKVENFLNRQRPNESEFKVFVAKEFGDWKNLLLNTVPTATLANYTYTLVNCVLTQNKQESNTEGFVAIPGPFPTSNYGNPLAINPLSSKLMSTMAYECLEDMVSKNIVLNTGENCKEEHLCKRLREELANLLRRQSPIKYRVLIVSAFKGDERDRGKYMESHSDYSDKAVELYPQGVKVENK